MRLAATFVALSLCALPASADKKLDDAIRKAEAHWQRNPEYPGAALYFGLTFAAVEPAT